MKHFWSLTFEKFIKKKLLGLINSYINNIAKDENWYEYAKLVNTYMNKYLSLYNDFH